MVRPPVAARRERSRRPVLVRSFAEALEGRRLLDGLTGQYFNRVDHTELVTTRTDPTIDFTWAGSPATGVKADHFGVRWTGQVEAQKDEVYTFYTLADDGVRLWADGRLLVDNWVNQGSTERSGSVAMQAGKRYDIRLDYYDYDQSARARLQWSSASTPKANVPASQLFASPSGLSATYFDNLDFTKPTSTRTESAVDFTWPTGQPDADMAPDGFSARYTGYIVPEFSETYLFRVVSDFATTARLRVDGKLVVDNGSLAADGRVQLEAGKRYAISLEYADGGGAANVRLDWQSPSRPRETVPASRLFAGALTAVPQTRATYTNPTLDIDAPDPGVIRADGAYWMLHTMGGPDTGWPLWTSPDMVHWTFVKHLLTTANKQSWMNGNYWAPEIHKVGTHFVLTGTSTDSRTGQLTIVMASSNEITGNYTIRSEPIVSAGVATLDSDIFQDDDGKQYLLWKRDSDDHTGQHGSIRIRQLDATGLNFAAGSTERVILDNETGGWENYLAEAPWLVKRADAYYLFYSGAFIDTTYSVGVARSTSLTQMFVRNPANPIISNNATWGGPGHGGFAMDNDGALWHLYHARRMANQDAGRKQVLDPVIWNGLYPSFANNSVGVVVQAGPLVDAASGSGILSLVGANTGNDTFRIARSASDASMLEVYQNNSLTKRVRAAEVQQISIDASGGDDTLVLDFTRGNVVPGGGVSFIGGAGSGDVVSIIDPNGVGNARFLGNGSIAFGSGLITTGAVERFNLTGGTNRVLADLGTVTVDLEAGQTTFEKSQKLGNLIIAAGAAAALGTGSPTLVTNSLSLAAGGKLDLRGGALVVDYASAAPSPMSAIVNALFTGRVGGTWNGSSGIMSSAVASAAASLAQTLGVAASSKIAANTIPGITLDSTAVVVRPTIVGDADLNLAVNFSDLVIVAQNYNTSGKIFGEGNFDYSDDGSVNFNDLVALAQHYNATYAPAAAALVAPATVKTKSKAVAQTPIV